jgi:hypothetical protein
VALKDNRCQVPVLSTLTTMSTKRASCVYNVPYVEANDVPQSPLNSQPTSTHPPQNLSQPSAPCSSFKISHSRRRTARGRVRTDDPRRGHSSVSTRPEAPFADLCTACRLLDHLRRGVNPLCGPLQRQLGLGEFPLPLARPLSLTRRVLFQG